MYYYINTIEIKSASAEANATGYGSEVNTNNIILVTEKYLNEAQRKMVHNTTEDFKRTCLQSFRAYTRWKVVQRTPHPTLRHITSAEDTMKFQDRIDKAMHHALINQSGVLKNSIRMPYIR